MEARLDAPGPAVGGRPARRSGHDASLQLGGRLAPVAERMVELAGVRQGQTVLAAAAGNDALLRAGVRRRASVVPAESVTIDWPHASFDAVLGFFSVTAHPDARRVAGEFSRVARSGAPIVLATWSGQPWARYETAYRHFFGFAELDVAEHELPESGMRYALVSARKP